MNNYTKSNRSWNYSLSWSGRPRTTETHLRRPTITDSYLRALQFGNSPKFVFTLLMNFWNQSVRTQLTTFQFFFLLPLKDEINYRVLKLESVNKNLLYQKKFLVTFFNEFNSQKISSTYEFSGRPPTKRARNPNKLVNRFRYSAFHLCNTAEQECWNEILFFFPTW